MTHFKVGQKVKIKEGGWGFHPIHVGKVVTIHSITGSGRYTTEETLQDSSTIYDHVARQTSVDGRSFEEVEQDIAAQIRAINVLIKLEHARIADATATIDAANATKDRLNHQRQVLIAAMLKELDA